MLKFTSMNWTSKVLFFRKYSTKLASETTTTLRTRLNDNLSYMKKLTQDKPHLISRLNAITNALSEKTPKHRILLQSLTSSQKDIACSKSILRALLTSPFLPKVSELDEALKTLGKEPLSISFGDSPLIQKNARYKSNHLSMPSDFLQVHNIEITYLPANYNDNLISASCQSTYMCSSSYLNIVNDRASRPTSHVIYLLDKDLTDADIIKNEPQIMPICSSKALSAISILRQDAGQFTNYKDLWDKSNFQTLRNSFLTENNYELVEKMLQSFMDTLRSQNVQEKFIAAKNNSNFLLSSLEEWAKCYHADTQNFELQLRALWKKLGFLQLYKNIDKWPDSLKDLIHKCFLQDSKLELAFLLGELSRNGDDKRNFYISMKDFQNFQSSSEKAVSEKFKSLKKQTLYVTLFQGVGALSSLYLYLVAHASMYNSFSIFAVTSVLGLYILQRSTVKWKQKFWKELLEDTRQFEKVFRRQLFENSSLYKQNALQTKMKTETDLLLTQVDESLKCLSKLRLGSEK
ncbi:meiotically upregulated Mug99 [Schizosaccharomyces cryophilus OY26]|uniref:Meiotically upregulated Mug99 n=1 Tax=Schizosaccharomyces cryophilus (strain OY26 / ATCC MYA-4695 / CBS 11777 / NBRC 106824 / NRRL Y48691) TaxID=653667 RepID=S9X8H1_SCHCR|nr:meiotically upregulated Mug99 [Schizosaccharomyces cryophilus OY26]EPY53427.1 meiotically upregulated Mug99 [Schizosaccharomyces cryophilus OY26]